MTVVDHSATPTCPSDDAVIEDDALDLRQLGQRFERILAASLSEQEATDQFVGLARQLTHGRTLLYFGLDSTRQLAANPVSRSPANVSDSASHQVYLLARRSQDTGSAQLVQLQDDVQDDSAHVAIAVPVFRRDAGVEALVVMTTHAAGDRRPLAAVLQVAQLLAAFAGQWRGCFDGAKTASKLDRLEMLMRAANAANQSARPLDAAEILADYLAQQFEARLVAIGSRRRGNSCRLVGMSNQMPLTRGAPLVVCIEAVLAERLAATSSESIDQVDTDERATEAVRQLRSKMETGSIYRIPLRDTLGATNGACLVVRDEPLGATEEDDLQQACEFIGPHLSRIQQGRLPWWRRAREAYDKLSSNARRTVIAAACASVFLLFVMPIPYRVKCRCEVQPVTRRFVAAPYEGRLQDAFVQPGDLVEAGQVLAVMDGREIRLELSALEAEVQRVTKQRDRALANRETAAAQIALLETQRLQSNMQLYLDRLGNLEIRSPTDGVVISGDPTKLKGARLTIGQTLLEVGSLGEMVLEVAIPDEQIAHVNQGANVRFRLDAMPQESFHGRVTRVHPRSELKDSQNVFVAEVQIAEESSSLRPGMRGRARLSAGRRTVFWICFHRAIDQLVFAMGW